MWSLARSELNVCSFFHLDSNQLIGQADLRNARLELDRCNSC